MPPKPEEKLFKPREAAAALGISYPTIKQWILRGKLKTVKTPGGHHRIPEAQLRAYRSATPHGPSAISGRNQLRGTIAEVAIDGLLAKVVLEIPGTGPGQVQKITAIITADAARELKLQRGAPGIALIKATEVMIGRP